MNGWMDQMDQMDWLPVQREDKLGGLRKHESVHWVTWVTKGSGRDASASKNPTQNTVEASKIKRNSTSFPSISYPTKFKAEVN